MAKAQQKSNWPTRKLIAAAIIAPIVGFGAPALGMEVGPEQLSVLIAAVSMLVGYFVPPSVRDQVEEVIEDIKQSQQ